jgi:hypothetical protein
MFATDADRLWSGFQTSAAITRRLHDMYQPDVRFYRPIDVVKALNESRICPTVVGNFGSGAWRREPQANGDVDVLVGLRSFSAAVDAVAAKFPRLKRSEGSESVAFQDVTSRWQGAVYHLLRPTTPLMGAAFRNRVWVPGGCYYAPNLEWAIASHFACSEIAAAQRNWRRYYEDLGEMLTIATNPAVEIDHARLRSLAAMIGRGAYKEMMVEINKSLAQVVDPQWHN